VGHLGEVLSKVGGSWGGFLQRLWANGGAPGAGGSDAVALVDPLQENDQGEYERLGTREGKRKDQETAALAPGVDWEPAKMAAAMWYSGEEFW
jgi:hypothetical protein